MVRGVEKTTTTVYSPERNHTLKMPDRKELSSGADEASETNPFTFFFFIIKPSLFFRTYSTFKTFPHSFLHPFRRTDGLHYLQGETQLW